QEEIKIPGDYFHPRINSSKGVKKAEIKIYELLT
ncbi:unnamed protein product, partial [marine sediment metagenome]